MKTHTFTVTVKTSNDVTRLRMLGILTQMISIAENDAEETLDHDGDDVQDALIVRDSEFNVA